jgi:hydroxypyruvate reductase
LRQLARGIFAEALDALDAGAAVRRAAHFERGRLKIFDDEFNLNAHGAAVYCVACGKAAGAMAAALDATLGGRLTGGVLSAPPLKLPLSRRWRVFEGGHPLPGAASLEAARAAFELLRRADEEAALVVFLISGGGSAMLEWPREPAATLADLREANRVLVTCGANIAEVNAVRRAFSAVKGGGLSLAAPRAAQVTLIVSDTAAGEPHAVASGPPFAPSAGRAVPDAVRVIERYDLAGRLPAAILASVAQHAESQTSASDCAVAPPARAVVPNGREPTPAPRERDAVAAAPPPPLRRHHVLLDNGDAVARSAEIARSRGLSVEVAEDIVEQDVGDGARLLISRLLELRARAGGGRDVCLISGGEFACPVRGRGVGGRNSETVLRCALELEARGLAGTDSDRRDWPRVVALGAGTDGVDGNSPAAGALCDETTIARARSRGLDPRRALDASDSHTFFAALDDALVTGPTGTNVRDLRILIAS